MEIKFGPAGNSDRFFESGNKSTIDAPAWLAKMGLNAYEYQCGRGVKLREETAEMIGKKARENGISLSVHAPYFINLSNPEPERREKTIDYVLQTCKAARNLGACRIVLHSGSLMGRSRAEALEIAKETMNLVIDACDNSGYGDIILCPELMGVGNQLGNLDEVIELCKVDKRLIPCIDFGHYNARNAGILKEKTDFEHVFNRMEEELGFGRVKNFHIHFSKIEFKEIRGEVRHLTYDNKDFGPEFDYAAEVIAERGYKPVIICESAGTQADDAVMFKKIYHNALKKVSEGH